MLDPKIAFHQIIMTDSQYAGLLRGDALEITNLADPDTDLRTCRTVTFFVRYGNQPGVQVTVQHRTIVSPCDSDLYGGMWHLEGKVSFGQMTMGGTPENPKGFHHPGMVMPVIVRFNPVNNKGFMIQDVRFPEPDEPGWRGKIIRWLRGR